MRIAAVGPVAAPAAAKHQAGDLDPRHHHRVPLPHGGDGEGGGGGGGQHEADEQQHRLLQLHQEAQQEPPSAVPVFQLQHLQAVRQSAAAEYALLAPMGDAAGHHGGFQPQLLSFGGVGVGVGQHHHLHQFTAQASGAASSHSRTSRAAAGAGGGGGEPANQRGVRSGTGAGEIVAVQGGHIVRSTGRKDRHSKVCTARGPRDRRVRLSAHTAIQFYDVQDRLGYDRPSKAVDWLIKNAKDAIDKLETLPAWHPTAGANPPPSSSTHPDADSAENNNNSDDQAQAITVAHPGSFDFAAAAAGGGGSASGGFLPSSLDSDSIADTIKSFFPMGGTGGGGGEASSSAPGTQSSAMGGGFQSYTPDLLSRTGSHSQELRLSLQSLPDPPPMSFQHHHHSQSQQDHGGDGRSHGGNGSALYSFGGAMWAEPAQQRMVPWTMPDPGGGGGYMFNVSQHLAGAQQSQFLFQRGPLQSSNNQPSDHRGWPDAVDADNPMFGFSGFRIPGRMQGDEDHNGGGSGNGDKPPPPSVSSASHH